MNPECNMPEEEQAAALELFDGTLTADEERGIQKMFPQYLFFRNEYEDDGWNVSSSPVRMCTCTACGQTFSAVRGNYARGKLNKEPCNCPECGARVEGRAVYKYRYEMNSLVSWVKTAVARVTADGALLIEAGDARRRFTHDELTGILDWYPKARYYFKPGRVQMWENRIMSWACDPADVKLRWCSNGRIKDPFLPTMMNYPSYAGDYAVAGLEEALDASELKYCQIMDFYECEYAAKLREGETARWIVKYLGWYVRHPQIEMAVKLGLGGAVCELIQDGKKNARLLNWNASTPWEFLRMSKKDARCFRNSGMGWSDLQVWKTFGAGLPFSEYVDLSYRAGGLSNLQKISVCAEAAGVHIEKAVGYVVRQQPDCARYAVPVSRIIQYWTDYLSMARELDYDLTEPTVAMPKNLQERHDAAAATIRDNADEAERKKYGRRKKQLEKRFAFAMGGLCVRIPENAREIVEEGKTLRHCVGGYAPRHIAGSTTILFLRHSRRPGRSFLTIELYEDRRRWKIRQIHGYRNESYAVGAKGFVEPKEKYAWFLDAWLGWVNDGSPRNTSGEPIIKEEVKTA